MSFVPANRARLLVGDAHLSCFLTQVGQDVSVDAQETTVLCDEAKTYLPTLVDGSLSLSGLFDGTPRGIHDMLKAKKGLHDAEPYTFAPAGLQAGQPVDMAQMLQMSYQVGAAVAGIVQVTAGGQVTGEVEQGAALVAPEPRTETGTGTAVDQTDASSAGGLIHLHVTAVEGTDPTLTVAVQHSVDGTTWVDLHVLPEQEDVGALAAEVSGTVNRHLRAVWTVGGTNPSFTFAVAFARR